MYDPVWAKSILEFGYANDKKFGREEINPNPGVGEANLNDYPWFRDLPPSLRFKAIAEFSRWMSIDDGEEVYQVPDYLAPRSDTDW